MYKCVFRSDEFITEMTLIVFNVYCWNINQFGKFSSNSEFRTRCLLGKQKFIEMMMTKKKRFAKKEFIIFAIKENEKKIRSLKVVRK